MHPAVHAARFRSRLAAGDPNAQLAFERLRRAASNGNPGARAALARIAASSGNTVGVGAFDVKANMVPAAVGTIGGAAVGAALLKPLWVGLLGGATLGGPLAVAAVAAYAYAKGTKPSVAATMALPAAEPDKSAAADSGGGGGGGYIPPPPPPVPVVQTSAGPVVPSSSKNLVELANIVASLPPPDSSRAGGADYAQAITTLNMRLKAAEAMGDLAATKEILTAYQAIGTPIAMDIAAAVQRGIARWNQAPSGAGYIFQKKVHDIAAREAARASQQASAAATAAAQRAAAAAAHR